MSIKSIFLWILIQAAILLPIKTNLKKNLRKVDESSDDIVIIHLNDVHCGINDTIGYDGFVLYRRELEQKYKYVLTVDVGDHVQGGTLGAISEGAAIIKIMNEVNFSVATLGNHEFDYGVETLNNLGQNITSRYICSNFCYKKNKTTVYQPYKVVEAGNKKIGFIGVVTPLTFSKTFLSTLRDEEGEYLYDFLVSDGREELYNSTQKYIDELRNNESVDYVILLTHMGMDIEEYTSNELLSKLTGVDAVLDGHTHLVYNKTSKDKDDKDIHISQTGTKLESIGQLIIKTDGSLITEIIKEVPEPEENITGAAKVTRSKVERWVDENMTNFMNEVYDEYSDVINAVIGKLDNDLIIRPENTTDSHYIYCRTRECTVGNLIADAIANGNADFAILNGGSVRSNMYKGNLTKGDIINALPWFGNVVVKKLPGQTVIDALEFGVRDYPKPSGGFPQVSSNLSYTFNPDINSTVITDSNGLFINITGERRITSVKVNGEPIDPNKNYSVALREFIAKGGDGFEMITPYDITLEGLATDTESLADFIQYELKGSIPESYAKIQGRITLYNETNPETETDSIGSNSSISSYKKSGKLSTGGIIAIIIPCVAILCIVGILALIIGKSAPPALSSMAYASESQNNFATKSLKI